MALIKCPECGLSISDKAAACPNCGYPLHPAPEPAEYDLSKSVSSDSKGAKFLRTCVWVDGIVLIIWTIVIIAIYTGEAFDWGGYFTTLGTYALYGCLIWCAASLFDDVHNISSALMSLRLQKTPINIKSPMFSNIRPQNNVAGSSPRIDMPVATQHSISLGSYPQGNTDGTASPILWILVGRNGNQSLLISKDILDFKPYDANGETTLWKHSSLRRWLNEDFYIKAFSESEKQDILPAQSSSTYDSSEADNVFLLNINEAKAYLDDQTLKTGNLLNWWWLRNSDSNARTVAYVDSNGYIHADCKDLTITGGVRPCIWVKNKPV